ncbi:MAG: hypothetical protein ACKPKO_37045, partial [Candidatus Fonsibacter sp.]
HQALDVLLAALFLIWNLNVSRKLSRRPGNCTKHHRRADVPRSFCTESHSLAVHGVLRNAKAHDHRVVGSLRPVLDLDLNRNQLGACS